MKLLQYLFCSLFVLIIHSAEAATTANSNFQTSASLNGTCQLIAGDVNTGAFAARDVESTSVNFFNMQIQCSKNVIYTVALDKGLYGTSVTDRKMAGSPGNNDRLSYSVIGFNDNTKPIWGDGTGATVTLSGIGDGTFQTVGATANIVIPLQQYVKPDIYTDTLTYIVTY